MTATTPNSHRIFQLVAGHPALDLINTLDWRFRDSGPQELLESYGDLVRFTQQSGLLGPAQAQRLLRTVNKRAGAAVLKSCVELREALAEVFYAAIEGRSPSAAPLRTSERYNKSAHLHQHLCWKESHAEWEWSGSEGEAELPLWLLSLGASDLMTSEAIQRLRACDSPDCHWLFLDTSRNHTRRWCDMKLCGNRMKARRFKAQHEL